MRRKEGKWFSPCRPLIIIPPPQTGSIDQVEEVAVLDWVQPRVLDLEQVASMRARIAQWCARVDETAKLMEAKTPELFAQ